MDSGTPYTNICADNIPVPEPSRLSWTIADYFAAMDALPIVYTVGNIVSTYFPGRRIYTAFAMRSQDVGQTTLTAIYVSSNSCNKTFFSLIEALEWLYTAILDKGMDKEADDE